jgi:hypothetical protein
VADMRRLACPRDRAHAVLTQHPRQCDLGRCDAGVPGGNGRDRGVAQDSALFDRRIGHDGEVVALAPRQQIVLDAASARRRGSSPICHVPAISSPEASVMVRTAEITDMTSFFSTQPKSGLSISGDRP